MALLTLTTTTAACIYLEEANYPPELTLVPSPGPYYRGEEIAATAEVIDRNPDDEDQVAVSYEVTAPGGAALPDGATSPCDPPRANCFVPHRLDLSYVVVATATDPRGAQQRAVREFSLENRPPTAGLGVRGQPRSNGHYPLLTEIQFTPLESHDDDLEDRCGLTYSYEVWRPAGSNTLLFRGGTCPVGDQLQGCPDPVPTYCMTPDAPGTYRVTLTVTDPSGATDSVEQSVEVDGDQPPCLGHFNPAPIARLFVSRSDAPVVLSVNVEDDLDPWPPSPTNASGFPLFTWAVQGPGDAAPVEVPNYRSNHYELDQAGFSAGDEVRVRVEVRDREDRSSTLVCTANAPVCPEGADPLSSTACVWRVTWVLEVY